MAMTGTFRNGTQPRGDPLSDRDFHARLTQSIPHLRAFARSLCGNADMADDLTQETLLKAWAARHHFVAGTRFRAWIFTILRNVFFGQIRRRRFVGDYDELEAERRLNTPATQQGALHAADVLRALQTLPAAQREVLILAAVGHVSYEEMARICGVAIGTIKSRMARARAALVDVINSGVMPEARHDFACDDVLDAFTDELRKIAPDYILARF
jgi:RNA polymerase sigma factor (sigma-70 family)